MGVRNRLMGIEGFFPRQADAWIEEWLTFTARDLDRAADWEAAWEWIVAQANGGRSPGDGKEPVRS